MAKKTPFRVWLLVASQSVYFAVVFFILVRSAAPDWRVPVALVGVLFLAAAAVGLSTWRFRFLPGAAAVGLILLLASVTVGERLVHLARHGGLEFPGDLVPF